MQDKQITVKFTQEEIVGLTNLLGELPTRSNVYGLLQNIISQVKPQMETASEPEATE